MLIIRKRVIDWRFVDDRFYDRIVQYKLAVAVFDDASDAFGREIIFQQDECGTGFQYTQHADDRFYPTRKADDNEIFRADVLLLQVAAYL